MAQSPDFESIKQISPYGIEFWSARDLYPLLGYDKWQNFETAIARAKRACEQVGQIVADQFTDTSKLIEAGKGAKRKVKDVLLSRFACYLVAQNGDPDKLEVAAAQAYFVITTRASEVERLKAEQDDRLRLRERVGENNKALAAAAHKSGVLSENFGIFQDAGYRGMYGGLGVEELKKHKGIPDRAEVLDHMGREELAANDFRITQTEGRLLREGVVGQTRATQVHHEVGRKVRDTIKEIGGTMPEDLPTEPSIKPLMDDRKRGKKKNLPAPDQMTLFDE